MAGSGESLFPEKQDKLKRKHEIYHEIFRCHQHTESARVDRIWACNPVPDKTEQIYQLRAVFARNQMASQLPSSTNMVVAYFTDNSIIFPEKKFDMKIKPNHRDISKCFSSIA